MSESPGIADCAEALADAVCEALPRWVERCVRQVMAAWSETLPPEVEQAAIAAGNEASRETGSAVRELLELDIDAQRTTPLTLVRAAVRYPTAVLRRAGAPPAQRDPFAVRSFPDDVYGLSPASWAEVGPELVEPAIRWGAAKAFEHKRRHGGHGGQG